LSGFSIIADVNDSKLKCYSLKTERTYGE